jgi:hypothetical protein
VTSSSLRPANGDLTSSVPGLHCAQECVARQRGLSRREGATMRFKALSLAIVIAAMVMIPAKAQTFQSGPMAFRLASDGGTGGNEWIVADGQIVSETPKVFRQFLGLKKIEQGARYEVYLNSPGGNLFGGVALGEIIREFGFGTRIAQSVPLNAQSGGYPFETDGPGGCYSACAFSFLGGKWRIASERSLGVHQHFIETTLSQPNAKKFTAADFSDVQMVQGLLAEYVVRMGVDARFLVRAATTVPSEIYTFTSDEMKQFAITWDDLEYSAWRLEPYKDGLISVSKTRNDENLATLVCRKDRALRLVIKSPLHASDADLDAILKSASTVSLFGVSIPPQNITGRIDRRSLVLELQLPPSLRTSDDNWLPDGKTPIWYVRLIQKQTHYEPTSNSWQTLSAQEQQSRRQMFELAYKAWFGVAPRYGARYQPIAPDFIPDSGGLAALGTMREYYDHKIPGKDFLSHSRLVGRNCT